MAQTFKSVNYEAADVLAWTSIYTAPSNVGDTSIALGLQFANTGVTSAKVGARLIDASTSASPAFAQNIDIPVGTALNVIAGKLVLEASDEIEIKNDVVSNISAILSVLEITV